MAKPTRSGESLLPYGVILREKSKTADLATLHAYRIVGNDLLKDSSGPHADDLRAALGDLEKAIAAKK